MLAGLNGNLPAELLKVGRNEVAGCICCGLFFLYAAGSFCGFVVVFWRKCGILYIQFATYNLTCFMLKCICGRRIFFRGTSPGCAKYAQLLFFAKIAGKNSASNAKSRVIPPPSIAGKKKSDKNLHQPKNLVYYICKREGQLLPIRQTDSPSEFLSFYVCAAAQSRGLFAAGRIRHTVCIKAKKRKEKSYENNQKRRKSNRVY